MVLADWGVARGWPWQPRQTVHQVMTLSKLHVVNRNTVQQDLPERQIKSQMV